MSRIASRSARELCETGADQQAKLLVDRLPAEGLFDLFQQQAGHEGRYRFGREAVRIPAEGRFELFRRQTDHEGRYRFGREADGSPAPSWGWDDLH